MTQKTPASPHVRRAAERNCVDLAHVVATGAGGRISIADVERTARAQIAATAPTPPEPVWFGQSQED